MQFLMRPMKENKANVAISKTAATTTASKGDHDDNQNLTKLLPGAKVYVCGWSRPNLAKKLFPLHEYRGKVPLSFLSTNLSEFSNDDVILFGMYGPCPVRINDLLDHFPGKVVLQKEISPRGITGITSQITTALAKNTCTTCTSWARRSTTIHPATRCPSCILTRFFSNLVPDASVDARLFDPAQRQKWNGNHSALVYLVSNCRRNRQEAAQALTSVVPVYYGGRCAVRNGMKLTVPRQAGYNIQIFENYKYCLVMENSYVKGYITEKLYYAFMGGCLPIWWGTTEALDIFNPEAFLYWNGSETLDKIRYLESNDTAYWEMLTNPILKHGERTKREYFSAVNWVGGGHVQRKLWNMMGWKYEM